MAVRTALLNWNVINRDADFSKHIEAVSEPWVISWLAVSSSSVATWEAFVKCERTNGDTIYALVYITTAQSISWDWDVYIEIPQEIVDNWELASEEWTDIATIEVWTMPDKNALKLATKSWNTITDARNMIKKVGELLDLINNNVSDIEDLDERVEALEEAWAINHLEESWIVGERYTSTDKLFIQKTPALSDSVMDFGCNVWDVSANKEIHIQRIWSGVASNQLKLKIKKIWSPTTWLVVEVKRWTQVNATTKEAYWYWWGDLIASGSILYSDISDTYTEKTITLNANIWWTEWELLDIVIYQTGSVVNASNYYSLACDYSQISEAFRFVSVNGSTRTRSSYMPYAISNWFMDRLLVKTKGWKVQYFYDNTTTKVTWTGSKTVTYTVPVDWDFYCTVAGYSESWTGFDYSITVDWVWLTWTDTNYATTKTARPYIFVLRWLTAWKVITFTIASRGSWWNATYSYSKVELYKWEEVWWLPKSVRTIWNNWYITLLGKHIDDKFLWWIMLGKDTVAGNWDIVLWNAVGYISVNFNWEVIKIPYYKN